MDVAFAAQAPLSVRGKRKALPSAASSAQSQPMDDEMRQQPTPSELEALEDESYWELGARKYFEGAFDAWIAEEDLEIPQDEIDHQVRRHTMILAGAIRDLVESYMAFDFDFDLDPYRRGR